MLTYKRLFSSFFFLLMCVPMAFTQNNTNSPYTRYGYGKIADQSYGQSLAMGGIGYGLRTPGQINSLNPASYSTVDSLTFLFDFGLMGEISWMNDGNSTQRDYNGNISYLAMQFRLMKQLGMSLGARPYSYVGYNYGVQETIKDTYSQTIYQGTGSLTQAYVGLGYELIKKRLSIGANVGFTFGNINRDIYLTFPEYSTTSTGTQTKAYPVTQLATINAHDFFWEVGAQYTHPLNDKDRITVGALFSPKEKFSAGNSITRTIYDYTGSSTSTIEESDVTSFDQELYMPMNIGVGFSYVKNNNLTLGADFQYQAWSKVPYPSENYKFKDRFKYSIGGEYVPNPYSLRNFWKKTRYRFGAYYSDSYVDIKGSGINEYGATVGLGLPFMIGRRESFLNIGAGYIRIVPEKNLIKEQYFQLTVGMTFSELWFYKRKFE